MTNKHKFNLAAILCILLAFLTINLSSLNVSNSSKVDISQTIDYEDPNALTEANKVMEQKEQSEEQKEKIDQEDLLALVIAVINVTVVTNFVNKILKIIMKKYNIKSLPEILVYLTMFISLLFFLFLYLNMNDSITALTIVASVDIFIFLGDFFFIKPYVNNINTKNKKEILYSDANLTKFDDITLGKASEFGINNTISLKQDIFRICCEINKAYMEMDTKVLKDMCTKELYERYNEEIKELKKSKTQWFIEDFNYSNCKITDISKNDDILTIKAVLRVAMKDYLIKEDKVIKGSKSKIVNNTYSLELKKSAIIRQALKCPNCGQSLKTTGSDKCPYCKTIIVSIGDDLVLNEFKKIKEK